MSMVEVRLFELACKGDRLDEINAEEALAAKARRQERRHRVASWLQRLFDCFRHTRKSTPATNLKRVFW